MVDDADIERRVRDTVARLPEVEVVDCDPALADTAAFCSAYGYDLDDSANAIVVIGRQRNPDVPPVYAACVVLASTRLDVNRVVRTRLGVRKASFAPPEVTAELTGMTMGGVTPFALPPNLPLWIDARVMRRDRVVVGGGSRRAKGGRPAGDVAHDPGRGSRLRTRHVEVDLKRRSHQIDTVQVGCDFSH